MIKTIPYLAVEYGLPRRTLHNAVKRGQFPAVQQGAAWLVDDTTPEFQAWLDSHDRHWRTKKAALRPQASELVQASQKETPT